MNMRYLFWEEDKFMYEVTEIYVYYRLSVTYTLYNRQFNYYDTEVINTFTKIIIDLLLVLLNEMGKL